jgi:hypothetical protein
VIARVSGLKMPFPSVAGLAALAALGCGTSSFEVPTYPHPDGAPAEVVGFMPPPAQVEHLDSKPPARGCRWADGQWIWAAQRWDWRAGAWIRPPEGCRYSPPTVQWATVRRAPSESNEQTDKQGVLYYRPGRWYSVGEPKACAEPVICPTESPAPLSIAQPDVASPDEVRSRS